MISHKVAAVCVAKLFGFIFGQPDGGLIASGRDLLPYLSNACKSDTPCAFSSGSVSKWQHQSKDTAHLKCICATIAFSTWRCEITEGRTSCGMEALVEWSASTVAVVLRLLLEGSDAMAPALNEVVNLGAPGAGWIITASRKVQPAPPCMALSRTRP